ncbi:MAG: Trm112 family protein [Gemmatimonadetes bacterium]|nr:Trm112 family protein [Gemmatimonadota bacterium]
MIDRDLLDILACPENKMPVKLADQPLIDTINSAIEKGEVKNRGEQKVEQPIDGGLVREDRVFLYPIQDAIPIMLIDEAIPIEKFVSQ